MNQPKQSEMTADKFRRMALGFAGASESAHMGHPDFRIEGKIFATLGCPDEISGMVKLTPKQQRSFVRNAPGVFAPCSGAWGRRGNTGGHLASVTADTLHAALDAAWRNVVTKVKKKDAQLGCSSNDWRICVGDYRVVYEITDVIRVVRVNRVRHRREVYG